MPFEHTCVCACLRLWPVSVSITRSLCLCLYLCCRRLCCCCCCVAAVCRSHRYEHVSTHQHTRMHACAPAARNMHMIIHTHTPVHASQCSSTHAHVQCMLHAHPSVTALSDRREHVACIAHYTYSCTCHAQPQCPTYKAVAGTHLRTTALRATRGCTHNQTVSSTQTPSQARLHIMLQVSTDRHRLIHR